MGKSNQSKKSKETERIDSIIRSLWCISFDETKKVADELVLQGKDILTDLISALEEMLSPSWRDPFNKTITDSDEALKGLVYAISRIGGKQAIEAIGEILKIEHPRVEKIFVEDLSIAFMRLGETGIDYLIKLLEYWRPQRSTVIEILVRIGTPAVVPLIKALEDEKRSIRAGAASVLGRINDARATGPLLDAYRRGLKIDDFDTLEEVETALKRMTNLQCTKLVQALEDRNELVRMIAADELSKVKEKAATNALINSLEDRSCHVRFLAAHSLDKHGIIFEENRKLKAKYLIAKKHWRKAEELGGIYSAEAFCNILDDSEESIRRRASKALTKIGKEAVPFLLDVLRSQVPEKKRFRPLIVETLVQIGKPALPYLKEAIQHESLKSANEIKEILEKISDRNLVKEETDA